MRRKKKQHYITCEVKVNLLKYRKENEREKESERENEKNEATLENRCYLYFYLFRINRVGYGDVGKIL